MECGHPGAPIDAVSKSFQETAKVPQYLEKTVQPVVFVFPCMFSRSGSDLPSHASSPPRHHACAHSLFLTDPRPFDSAVPKKKFFPFPRYTHFLDDLRRSGIASIFKTQPCSQMAMARVSLLPSLWPGCMLCSSCHVQKDVTHDRHLSSARRTHAYPFVGCLFKSPDAVS